MNKIKQSACLGADDAEAMGSGNGTTGTPFEKSLQFKQIRSATVLVSVCGVRFLIDPWLGAKDSYPPLPGSVNPGLCCPVHELPISVEEILAQTDAVIATHLHFDHFDEVAYEKIPKEMVIFAQDEVDAAVLRSRGFKDVRVLKFSGTDFRGVNLVKTGCHHGVPGKGERLYEAFEMRMEACGVVFSHPQLNKKLYLVGDSIWCDYVAAALEIHKPDFVIVNAAEATIQGYDPIIMGLRDIQAAMRVAPDATFIASHMDNVGHAALWRKDLHKFVKEESLEKRLLIPEDGETIVLESK